MEVVFKFEGNGGSIIELNNLGKYLYEAEKIRNS